MNILSSQVTATNQHQSQYRSHRQVTLAKPAPTNALGNGLNNNAGNGNSSSNRVSINLNLSSESIESIQSTQTNQPPQLTQTEQTEQAEQNSPVDEAAHYEKGIFIMKLLLEEMTGKAIKLFNPNHFMQNVEGQNIEGSDGVNSNNPAGQTAQGRAANPNDIMQVAEYRFESESNQLSFSGSISREDGSEQHFSFAVSFAQQHESLTIETLKREELKDPLVISFTSKPVTLSNKRFDFDIDADNKNDKIALLEAGHGFLALDKNQDGKINDGNELFGALSGNGFADLASYDDDGNGFIDEGDSIFSNLSIWIKNEGEDRLVSLKDTNIGAIALENVDSPYTVRSNDEKMAMIRKSGFYLNEDGSAGLIQQLDFVV